MTYHRTTNCKYGYKQFGPENRLCKWWDGNIITTMGLVTPKKPLNQWMIVYSRNQYTNVMTTQNVISCLLVHQMDWWRKNVYFIQRLPETSWYPHPNKWCVEKDDANFIGGTPTRSTTFRVVETLINNRLNKLNDGNWIAHWASMTKVLLMKESQRAST